MADETATTTEESVYQNLVNQGYTEEQIKLIMELGAFNLEDAIREREEELTSEERMASGPEGRHLGRVYVASSPLEHLAHQGNKIYGEHRQRQMDEAARELEQERVQRRIEFLRGADGPSDPAVRAAAGAYTPTASLRGPPVERLSRGAPITTPAPAGGPVQRTALAPEAAPSPARPPWGSRPDAYGPPGRPGRSMLAERVRGSAPAVPQRLDPRIAHLLGQVGGASRKVGAYLPDVDVGGSPWGDVF